MRVCWGKSKGGAHKRGLKPQIFRENRAKILPGKSGLFGPDWSLFRAYRRLFGADWDRFLRTSQPRGAAEIPPKGPFWAQLAPFGLSPRLLSPRLDFPNTFLVWQEWAVELEKEPTFNQEGQRGPNSLGDPARGIPTPKLKECQMPL